MRKSKRLINGHHELEGGQLVAISIVPPAAMVAPGNLQFFSIENFHRRLKYALVKAGVNFAVGGIDFSFNEDRNGSYSPFWSPHLYVITILGDKAKIRTELAEFFKRCHTVPRPLKITPFYNNARRRSYALKTYFARRIAYEQTKGHAGKRRRCRNTSFDKIRSADPVELLLFLDSSGLAQRPFFLGCKPHVTSRSVKLLKAA